MKDAALEIDNQVYRAQRSALNLALGFALDFHQVLAFDRQALETNFICASMRLPAQRTTWKFEKMRFISPAILAVSFLSSNAIAQESESSNWTFSIEPYVLASSINGDASAGRVAGIAVDVSFSDILENLQMAGMLHFEAQHRNGWGMIFDYGFMDLGADSSVGFGGVIDANVRQGIFEVLATRRIDSGSSTLELLAGIRRWDNKVTARFDPLIWSGSVSTTINEDWVDPVVGLRWTNALSDRWQWRLRGDIGGLGIGSDFSWSASATAFYNMSDRFDLEMGYKAVDVNYDNGKATNNGYFAYDTMTHGPLFGLVIKF